MMLTTSRALSFPSVLAAAALLAGPAREARAALPDPPHEDIHFVLEHVPEAAQDARFFALPWPAERLSEGRFQAFAGAGWSEAKADFISERGSLASLGAAYGLSPRSGLSLFGFYDQFRVSGGSGEQVLRPRFAPGIPLDLPERALFSHPRGEFRHFGLGASYLCELSPAGARRPWTLQAGLLLERLELTRFRLDAELLGGADAGARVVLDHSSRATFFTPYVGIEKSFPLGSSLVLRPRILAGVPLPAGDFDGRLTGPGFDASSRDPGGKPGAIGDGFVALGVGLLHRPSGLELDLGAALGFAAFEPATHEGLGSALLMHLSWHLPRRR